jgi:hypothetical protein
MKIYFHIRLILENERNGSGLSGNDGRNVPFYVTRFEIKLFLFAFLSRFTPLGGFIFK